MRCVTCCDMSSIQVIPQECVYSRGPREKWRKRKSFKSHERLWYYAFMIAVQCTQRTAYIDSGKTYSETLLIRRRVDPSENRDSEESPCVRQINIIISRNSELRGPTGRHSLHTYAWMRMLQLLSVSSSLSIIIVIRRISTLKHFPFSRWTAARTTNTVARTRSHNNISCLMRARRCFSFHGRRVQ